MDFDMVPPGYVHPDHMAPHTEDYYREAYGDTAIDPEWENEQDVDAIIAEHELAMDEILTAGELEPPF